MERTIALGIHAREMLDPLAQLFDGDDANDVKSVTAARMRVELAQINGAHTPVAMRGDAVENVGHEGADLLELVFSLTCQPHQRHHCDQ